jgi:hypothetical protein
VLPLFTLLREFAEDNFSQKPVATCGLILKVGVVSKSALGKRLGQLLEEDRKPIKANGLNSNFSPSPSASSLKASTLDSEKKVEVPLAIVSVVLFWIDLFVCAVSWLLFEHSTLNMISKNILLCTGFTLGAAAACLGVWLFRKKAMAD